MPFLLPCECGRKTTVGASQAGGQVACACGKTLEVPALRGLQKLEPAPDDRPQRPPWTLSQGLMFLGAALALFGAAFAAVLLANMPQPPEPLLDDATFARSIKEFEPATPQQTFEFYDYQKKFYDNGMPPESAPWTQAITAQKQNLARYVWISAGVAVAGIVLGIGGWLAALRPQAAPASTGDLAGK